MSKKFNELPKRVPFASKDDIAYPYKIEIEDKGVAEKDDSGRVWVTYYKDSETPILKTRYSLETNEILEHGQVNSDNEYCGRYILFMEGKPFREGVKNENGYFEGVVLQYCGEDAEDYDYFYSDPETGELVSMSSNIVLFGQTMNDVFDTIEKNANKIMGENKITPI